MLWKCDGAAYESVLLVRVAQDFNLGDFTQLLDALETEAEWKEHKKALVDCTHCVFTNCSMEQLAESARILDARSRQFGEARLALVVPDFVQFRYASGGISRAEVKRQVQAQVFRQQDMALDWLGVANQGVLS